MANYTALKIPVLAGAPPFRLNWSGSGSGSARKQLLMTGSSRMFNVGRRPRMMMGKYKGTQMREKQLTEMIEKKVIEAKEVCGEDDKSDECRVAWDEVEEVSQAKADLRLKLEIMHQDPLESFCQENPDTDECRIYED